MGRWDQRYLGHIGFPESLSALEIDRFFTPASNELTVVLQRRSDPNRIAFALQIGFLKMTGRVLNTVEIVPHAVLEHLSDKIGCAAPRIASIRALYRRRRTLFDHQSASQKLIGRSDLSGHAERWLTAYLRREAIGIYDISALMKQARIWLIDHNYVLPREKDIRRLAVRAMRHQEQILFKAICAATPETQRETWAKRLTAAVADDTASFLEWVQAAPPRKTISGLDGQLAKVAFLGDLGAANLGPSVLPAASLEHFNRQVLARRPAVIATIKEPRRTIELACFLRLQLMRVTDTGLTLVDNRIAAQWRDARDRALGNQAARLQRFRGLIGNLAILADDEDLSAEGLRNKLRDLVAPFESELNITQVFAIRQELARSAPDLARLLKAARSMGLQMDPGQKLGAAFATLDQLAANSLSKLPPTVQNPFGPSWQSLIDQPDREAAFKAYLAATAMHLKRALRNRSVTAESSLTHQGPEGRLIPQALWMRDKGRYLRNLSMPQSAEAYVRRLEQQLELGLASLAMAVEAGDATIDQAGFHLPRRPPAPKDPMVKAARKAVNLSFGAKQMAEVMVEIDSLTQFSWRLLGHPPASERELVTLYAALLALGSDLTAADLLRMVPQIDGQVLERMIQRLEIDPRLRTANDDVVRFMRKHPVASLWGKGTFASGDMMSLDATRHLWNSRLEPRRKGPAIGTYPHVLDQWSIFYDQPIVLNRRQAGAAIEGALRQNVVEKLEGVAVDTHGFTHFAMAMAKIVGFDLLPRLAGLKMRKLFLPARFDGAIPAILKPIIAPERVSRKTIARGWDGLLRLGASVKDGWYPATDALDQYGSACSGDKVYVAGVGVGKLLRSIFLCDYLGNTTFRNDILDLLNQGEAIHSLQRAIHDGAITAKRGRSHEQMVAISGALTLLTNIVLASNTRQIQNYVNEHGDEFPDSIIGQVAPISYAHINMRGLISFDLGAAKAMLLGSKNEPVSSHAPR